MEEKKNTTAGKCSKGVEAGRGVSAIAVSEQELSGGNPLVGEPWHTHDDHILSCSGISGT